jgi:hypothetical protein
LSSPTPLPTVERIVELPLAQAATPNASNVMRRIRLGPTRDPRSVSDLVMAIGLPKPWL